MFAHIKTYIKTHIDVHLKTPLLDASANTKAKVILGLSGGPDSIFLLHLLKNLEQENKIELKAAHLDHGWRVNSSQDVQFCAQACAKLNIKFICTHLNSLAFPLKERGSQEALGRAARRHFFENILKQESADVIALAHHQQDQQETFFLRLIRGCSLSGLTGMAPVAYPYIRPLLATSKQDIILWLQQNNIPYLTDASNLSDTYVRNRIRNHVIPALTQCDARFNKKFASSLFHLQEEDLFLQTLAQKTFEKLFINSANQPQPQKLIARCNNFLALAPALQRRVLLVWLCANNVPFTPSARLWEEIIRFLASPRGGSHALHTSWIIMKKNGAFWIEQGPSLTPKHKNVLCSQGDI